MYTILPTADTIARLYKLDADNEWVHTRVQAQRNTVEILENWCARLPQEAIRLGATSATVYELVLSTRLLDGEYVDNMILELTRLGFTVEHRCTGLVVYNKGAHDVALLNARRYGRGRTSRYADYDDCPF